LFRIYPFLGLVWELKKGEKRREVERIAFFSLGIFRGRKVEKWSDLEFLLSKNREKWMESRNFKYIFLNDNFTFVNNNL
jgi:hypothetical protein